MFFDKNHIEFPRLCWLAHSVALRGNPSYDGIISVEDLGGGVTGIITTDSWRLAILKYREDCPLEKGYWKIKQKSKTSLVLENFENELKYPNWKVCVPKEFDREIKRGENGFWFSSETFATDLHFVFGSRCWLNYKWLKDLGMLEANWRLRDTYSCAWFESMPVWKGDWNKDFDFFGASLLMMKLKAIDISELDGNNSEAKRENIEEKQEAENESREDCDR
jgi:hypothetical protein